MAWRTQKSVLVMLLVVLGLLMAAAGVMFFKVVVYNERPLFAPGDPAVVDYLLGRRLWANAWPVASDELGQFIYIDVERNMILTIEGGQQTAVQSRRSADSIVFDDVVVHKWPDAVIIVSNDRVATVYPAQKHWAARLFEEFGERRHPQPLPDTVRFLQEWMRVQADEDHLQGE